MGGSENVDDWHPTVGLSMDFVREGTSTMSSVRRQWGDAAVDAYLDSTVNISVSLMLRGQSGYRDWNQLKETYGEKRVEQAVREEKRKNKEIEDAKRKDEGKTLSQRISRVLKIR